MRIEFKVIAPEKNALETQALKVLKGQLEKHLKTRLKDIECSEHHEKPRVIVTGSLRSPEFKIEGCCQKLINEATEAIK